MSSHSFFPCAADDFKTIHTVSEVGLHEKKRIINIVFAADLGIYLSRWLEGSKRILEILLVTQTRYFRRLHILTDWLSAGYSCFSSVTDT